MENKKLNEQESLALITQMIQNSKKGLVVGSGNSFLFWGYLSSCRLHSNFPITLYYRKSELVLVGDCDSGDRMSVYLLGFPAEW